MQAVERANFEAVTLRMGGATPASSMAQINSFRLRALRAEAPARHVYVTDWHMIAFSKTVGTVVVIGSEESAEQAIRCDADERVVVAMRTPSRSYSLVHLCTLQMALGLVQAQATMAREPVVWEFVNK